LLYWQIITDSEKGIPRLTTPDTNMEKIIEKIQDAAQQQADIIFRTSNDHAKGTINVFWQQVDSLLNLYNEVCVLLEERQFWIEYHCGPFDVTLHDHELYHICNQKILNTIRDFFTTAKIVLNSFSTLLAKLLPQKKLRSVNTRSFGSFVKSSSFLFDSPNIELQQLGKLFAGLGQYIDDTVCAYRDKHIEHDKSLKLGFLSTSPQRCVVKHYSPQAVPSYLAKSDSNVDKKKIFLHSMKIATPYGADYSCFHVKSSYSIGETVKKSSAIGIWYEHPVHFDQYGQHVHQFPSNNLKIHIPEVDFLKPTQVEQSASPDIHKSMINVMEFIKQGFSYTARFLKTNNTE